MLHEKMLLRHELILTQRLDYLLDEPRSLIRCGKDLSVHDHGFIGAMSVVGISLLGSSLSVRSYVFSISKLERMF